MKKTLAAILAILLLAGISYGFSKKKVKKDYYEELKASGAIFAGMIPKLDNAFAAIEKGVKKVTICQAEQLVEAVKNGNAGTAILK